MGFLAQEKPFFLALCSWLDVLDPITPKCANILLDRGYSMKQKIAQCIVSFLLIPLALACDEGDREEGQPDTSGSDSNQDTATTTGPSDSDSLSDTETGDTGADSDTGNVGSDSDTEDAGLDSDTGDAGADSGTGDTDTDTDTGTNTALSSEITSFQGLTHFLLRGLVVTLKGRARELARQHRREAYQRQKGWKLSAIPPFIEIKQGYTRRSESGIQKAGTQERHSRHS